MTETQDSGDGVEMVTAEVEVPPDGWLEDFVEEATRFDTVDDFVMQVFDSTYAQAQEMQDLETEAREISVPADTVDRLEEVNEMYDDVDGPLETVGFILQSVYVRNRQGEHGGSNI